MRNLLFLIFFVATNASAKNVFSDWLFQSDVDVDSLTIDAQDNDGDGKLLFKGQSGDPATPTGDDVNIYNKGKFLYQQSADGISLVGSGSGGSSYTYDSEWQTAEQTYPLAHGMPTFPAFGTFYYDNAGTIVEYPIGQYCEITASNLDCEIDSLLTIDGTHKYRIFLAAQGNIGGTEVPTVYDSEWLTAEASYPLSHNLGQFPTYQVFLYDDAGTIRTYPIGQYCSVSETQLDCEVDSKLTIDGTHKYRVVMTTPGVAAGTREYTNKTTTYTAVSGDLITTDSSGGAFTITLPASPSYGEVIEVYDGTADWDAEAVTLGRNSSNINGAASDLVLDVEGAWVKVIYVDATEGWRSYQ